MSICRKQGFDSPSEAFSRLKEIKAYETKRDTTPVRYYQCDRCGLYHLTSKTVHDWRSSRAKSREKAEIRRRRLQQYKERRFDPRE